MTDHAALIERLEKAEAGSRELDYAIKHWLETNTDDSYWKLRVAADWTASIDAALALVERVLPGWSYGLFGEVGGGATFTLEQPDVDLGDGVIASPGLCGFEPIEGDGKTPALSVCIALLKALRSQQKGEG